jgi:hypothetical protein
VIPALFDLHRFTDSMIYLASRVFLRDELDIAFAREGFGIRSKRRQFSRWWQSHETATKQFQAKIVSEYWDTNKFERAGNYFRRDEPHSPSSAQSGSDVLIFGAGRLYDCDLEFLSRYYERIILVDADRTAGRTWKLLRPDIKQRVIPIIGDCTGRIRTWQFRLREILSGLPACPTVEQIVSCLQTSTELDQESFEALTERFLNLNCNISTVISLNVLSQLQLVWQRNVEALLRIKFGAKWTDAHEAEWLGAVRAAGANLITEHFRLICSLSPQLVVVIGDLLFLEQDFSSGCPFLAAKGQVTADALCSVIKRYDESAFDDLLGTYSRIAAQSWEWSVSSDPQGKVYKNLVLGTGYLRR